MNEVIPLPQSWRHISGHSKVRILIDRTWNEAWNVFSSVEDKGEGRAEAWRSLDGREADFANTVAVGESEDVFDLVVVDALLNSQDVFVEL